MARISAERAAQVAIVILVLIILRSLGEVFRLRYVQGDALTIAEVVPYVGSALATTLVLAGALGAYCFQRYRLVIGGTVATVVLLLIYKIAIIG